MNLQQQILDTITDLEAKHPDWPQVQIALSAIKTCGIEIYLTPTALDAGMDALPSGALSYAQLALAYNAIIIQREKEYARNVGDNVSC